MVMKILHFRTCRMQQKLEVISCGQHRKGQDEVKAEGAGMTLAAKMLSRESTEAKRCFCGQTHDAGINQLSFW